MLEIYPLSVQILKAFACFEVRNGARVFFFWHDTWCEDQRLKIQFLNLFRMACLRDAMVHDVYSWNETQHHWDITFIRSSNDWEEESIISYCLYLRICIRLSS